MFELLARDIYTLLLLFLKKLRFEISQAIGKFKQITARTPLLGLHMKSLIGAE